MKDDGILKATIASVLVLGLGAVTNDLQADTQPKLEKCYGIAKKGMNLCGAYNHSCEGQSAKDGDPNEWMYVLEGTCSKIVGGSLKPEDPATSSKSSSSSAESAKKDKDKK